MKGRIPYFPVFVFSLIVLVFLSPLIYIYLTLTPECREYEFYNEVKKNYCKEACLEQRLDYYKFKDYDCKCSVKGIVVEVVYNNPCDLNDK